MNKKITSINPELERSKRTADFETMVAEIYKQKNFQDIVKHIERINNTLIYETVDVSLLLLTNQDPLVYNANINSKKNLAAWNLTNPASLVNFSFKLPKDTFFHFADVTLEKYAVFWKITPDMREILIADLKTNNLDKINKKRRENQIKAPEVKKLDFQIIQNNTPFDSSQRNLIPKKSAILAPLWQDKLGERKKIGALLIEYAKAATYILHDFHNEPYFNTLFQLQEIIKMLELTIPSLSPELRGT